ncbi:cell division protein FtsW [Sphingomonas lacunae]|uniref:Probable peptidoglycan glycosyltransferase FtsW n=1 Tax=Sphingomonas lacunae TaxID=2698828 RepID=A0A6M4AW33_9SPHN|nr:putative peptidoglycan glycosyltransferase FtsW [Sphingomonas lacunae]QJQ33305.1 cell division protein FtsW [Sphingomonas lacunae]
MNNSSTDTGAETPIVPPELHGRRRPAPLSRADRSPLAKWYAEVDRGLLAMILGLMAIGLLAVAVASPVGARVAARRGQEFGEMYYLWRQLFWVATGIGFMIFFGMRSKLEVRRIALWGTVAGILALFAVLVVGTEVNGSQRWLGSGVLRLQPSEFLKPMFAVSMAWILSCRVEDETLPVFSLTMITTALVAALLMLEPDFGQTVLYVGTWVVLVFVAGLPMRAMGYLGGGIGAFLLGTYFLYDNARNRIDGFLFGQGDSHQVDRGLDTLSNSGLIGSGPFTGTAKFRLPEAHTDYIYSVIGEEFGLIACAGILVLYVALIVRVLQRLREERDQFVILAGTGLVAQFGGQVMINIAVNLQLAPSKGMTLPFISYGGSSLWALSITMGFLLALTRRNPYRAPPLNLNGWNPR